MSKILLTGSTGFVGKNLLPKLINLGYDVIQLSSKDGDIVKEETWINLPQTEIVIHLASKTSVPESWTKSYDYINCNLMGTVNALNYCKQHNSKLIFISSYLYGNPDQLPINENASLKPTNPYALSKLLSEQACEYYSKSENIKIVILRPFNIFGPGQSDNYLIQFIISQLETINIIKVKDLIPKRDYIYIDDFTDAIVKSLTLNSNFNIFNIGSGQSYSVKEVIDIIQNLLNTDASVESENERRKNEIMDTIADISLANKTLNWSPKTSFIEGIQNILNKH
jgi:GDP-4-dehydro-6-deoxy-D-mannose reductase